MKFILTFSLLAAFVFSCAKEKSSEDVGSTSETDSTTQGTLAISAENISDVNASQALQVNVPSSVLGKGKATTVTEAGSLSVSLEVTQEERKKSSEACYLRNRLKEELLQLKEASLELCSVEAESVGVGFGTKYTVSSDDAEGTSYQFWADNSKYEGGKGSLTIHVCEDEVPYLKMTITGSRDGASKGRFKFIESSENEYWASTGFFDNKFSNKNRINIASNQYGYESGVDFEEEYVERFHLSLSEDGISHVRMSSEGFVNEAAGADSYEESYLEVSAARFGKRLGSIVFAGTHSDESGNKDVNGFKSYFDGKGNYLNPLGLDIFADGSKLLAKVSDMPKPLDRTFRVPEFDATKGDWDCQGTVEIPEIEDEAVVTKQDVAFEKCDELQNAIETESSALDKEDCSNEAIYVWGGAEEIDLTTLDAEFSEEDLDIDEDELEAQE